MNWLWHGMLPSELELTPHQRSAVLQRASQKAQKSLRIWMPLSLLIPLAAYMLVVFQATWVQSTMGQLPSLVQLILWALPSMIPAVFTTAIQRRMMRRHLHAALNEIGCRTCPRCRYWLRGLSESQSICPECGASVGGNAK